MSSRRSISVPALVILTGLLSCIWAPFEHSAQAQPQLEAPQNNVILAISGKVAQTNTPDSASFDRSMLEGLGTTTLRTSTPWTDGIQEFRGVLVRDVLERAGAEGQVVRAIAHNDYIIDIPAGEFRDYPVLLALEMNGAKLELKDKGPIWIVYPLDQFEALQDRATERKMVWQLKELQVR